MQQELIQMPSDVKIDISFKRILELLPHRYPFLLIDRVVSLVPGLSVTAYKNVSINEPFFQGHFPGIPVMPGVLILEALAQAGGIIFIESLPPEELAKKIFLFTGVENVRFRKQVVPGDKLDLQCTLLKKKLHIWKIDCEARVNNTVVTTGILSAAMVSKEAF